MTRQAIRTACAAVAIAATACGDSVGPILDLPRELTSAEQTLVAADNAFAVRLLGAVHDEADPTENVFVSPLSVSMALGMTLNGAAGETRDAMAATLGFGDLGMDDVNAGYRDLIDLLLTLDERVTFGLANSIWHRPELGVEADFLNATRAFFDAQVEALDFGAPNAPDVIDQWVRDRTGGRIDGIAPRPIAPEIVMFLINAVYFKGDWTYQFDPSRTADRVFTLDDGSERMVPTMTHAEPVPVRLAGDALAGVIEMPYGGDAFAMVAAVPRGDVTLDELLDALDDARWAGWVDGLAEAERVVVMPKFEFTYDIRLNDALSALGMGIAFDPARADFAGINPALQLFIDRVQHKTFVKVDEVGTEAAAATSVGIGLTSAPAPFVIDRPFLFAIRERLTGAVLFLGKVVTP